MEGGEGILLHDRHYLARRVSNSIRGGARDIDETVSLTHDVTRAVSGSPSGKKESRKLILFLQIGALL